MEVDSFLALPRWEILQIIADRPSSPIEIAEITGTTVSYVSQQLKLLEAGGLVQKKKTGAFEKGQPRNIFSLKEEFVHLSILSEGFAHKEKVHLNPRRKALLKIWILEESPKREELVKFLTFFDNYSDEGDLAWDVEKDVLIVVSEDSRLKSLVDLLIKKLGLKIITKLVSPNKFDVSGSLFLTSRKNWKIDEGKNALGESGKSADDKPSVPENLKGGNE